jgi:hypothetical protein
MALQQPDRLRVLLAVVKRPLTTLELAQELQLGPDRVARAVRLLLEDGALEHCAQKAGGWNWLLTDRGVGELSRAGFKSQVRARSDETVDFNMRRM